MSDNGIHAHAPSHDGSRGIENNRHVHYEVDTHSLASDDDMRELEVRRCCQDYLPKVPKAREEGK